MPDLLFRILSINGQFQLQWPLTDATYSIPVWRGSIVTAPVVVDQILVVFVPEVVNNKGAF